MKSALKNKSDNLRRFTIGIVGASDSTIESFKRIFTATQYRARCYHAVKLDSRVIDMRSDIDLIMMCSANPNIVSAWEKELSVKGRKMVLLSNFGNKRYTEYQMQAPVNPAKLIRLLDQYTIKELNFFPEFEIGQESSELDGLAVTGIKLLRSNAVNRITTTKNPNCRALVVDDSLAVRTQLQIEFELLQVPVDLVDSAEGALKTLSESTYNIIFMDVVMPGMDGYTACKKIKRSKLNKNTPVVLLTSKSSSFDKIKGSLAGCDAYMVKPVNHNEFAKVYAKHVRPHTGEIKNDNV